MSADDRDPDQPPVDLASELDRLRARVAELEEFRDRCAQYEFMLNHVAESITVQDRNGDIIFANAPAARAIGHPTSGSGQRLSSAEITQHFRIYDEAGAPFPIDQLPGRRALRGEPEPRAVLRFAGTDSSDERWAAVRARAISSADGEVRQVVNFFRDITQQRTAEIALEQRERRFRALIERSLDAIAVIAPDGVFRYASPANARLLGIPADELIGRSAFDLVHPDDRQSVARSIAALIASPGISQTDRIRLRCQGRSWCWVEWTATNLLDDPSVSGIVINYHDITQHQQAVESLRFLAEASDLLATSLDYERTLRQLATLAVPQLGDWCRVDVLDQDQQIRPIAIAHVDPERARWAEPFMLRYPINPDAPGGIAQVLRTGKPVFVADVTEDMIRAVAMNEDHLAYLRRIGFRSMMVVPLLARGRVLGTIWFSTAESGRRYTTTDLELAEDLARRAAISVDNARLYQEAQEALRLRGEFLSIAAHELRTPLTTIKVYAQLLERDLQRDPPDTDRLGQRVVQLREQIGRFENLVADLLDASRIQQGKLGLRREPLDLAALARDVLARFEDAPERRPEHRLILDAPEPMPGEWDGARLDQVLTNLLSNALKFSPAGGEVRLSLRRDKDQAELVVSDQGVGIPHEEQRHLFQPFSRGAIGSTVEGTGLGLYISREILEQHGGTIEVESSASSGATFRIRLPLQPPDRDDGLEVE